MDELNANGYDVRPPPPVKVRGEFGATDALSQSEVAVRSLSPSPPSSPESPTSPIAWLEPAAVSIPGLFLDRPETTLGHKSMQQQIASSKTGIQQKGRQGKREYVWMSRN